MHCVFSYQVEDDKFDSKRRIVHKSKSYQSGQVDILVHESSPPIGWFIKLNGEITGLVIIIILIIRGPKESQQ